MRVDVIDDRPFLYEALTDLAAQHHDERLSVGFACTSWIEFSREWDAAADVVIFRVELYDHVPAVLKVRALSRLSVSSLAVAENNESALRRRLIREGCATMMMRDCGLDALIAEMYTAARSSCEPAPPDSADLTDRELQIAALFAGREAPSSTRLATLLGISPETIRAHLARARTKLRSHNYEVSSRGALRKALIAEGWLSHVQ